MISFEPLAHTLIRKRVEWVELYKQGIISRPTLQKIKRNIKGKEYGKIRLDTVEKICLFLNCKIEDVVQIIPDNQQ